MKYIVVDLKAGNLFVNQNGVKNRVACMAPTGKKNKNKTTIGKISFCFCNRPDQPGRVVIYVGVKSIQSICNGRYALLVWNECRASFKDYGIGCFLTEIRVLPWSHCSKRHKPIALVSNEKCVAAGTYTLYTLHPYINNHSLAQTTLLSRPYR